MPLFVNLIALFLTWISQIVLRAHGVEVPFIIPCMSILTLKQHLRLTRLIDSVVGLRFFSGDSSPGR